MAGVAAVGRFCFSDRAVNSDFSCRGICVTLFATVGRV